MLGRFPLGVMEGRLVPKYRGRYQAHPIGYWREEFDVAAECGLELIEFILDYDGAEENPLLADPAAILGAVNDTGVSVKSICADYFMESPIQRVNASIDVLGRLIDSAVVIGVRDIVIPCVDQSSLGGDEASAFAAAIQPLANKAQDVGINLALETDLAPKQFSELLDAIGSAAVTVNYDTGNSAALGFDCREEFAAYGERITDIHLKDRVLGGGPIELGQGATDFETVMCLIANSNFDGPLIMQAYRDDEGVGVFKKQKAWLEDNYGEILKGRSS
ncbi:MAG: sugar phosphate isomerase/epimerase [Magnetovibrio sp.]|nr:sugar phosphate isomerase/epimerase [Magnetovibrio sp.]